MRLLAVVLAIALLGITPSAHASQAFAGPSFPGQVRTVPNWRMHPATGTGDQISAPGYDDSSWLDVPARSTVMAGLLAKYPGYTRDLRDVDTSQFTVPWWYRRTFTSPATAHTFLRLNGGVISRGEVWLNGTQVGTPAGAYPRFEYDVTGLLRRGENAVAIKAMPADPFRDLTVSFLDWSPPAPDNNMGVWRDVSLANAGDVSLLEPRVLTTLTSDLQQATLTARTEVRNNTSHPVTATLLGTIDNRPLIQRVSLQPNERRTIAFRALEVDHPRMWWPAQFGDQPMYRLSLTAITNGLSDHVSTDFGIREVTSSLNAQGARQFFVNGRPFVVRGGGWASDLFLRAQPGRLAEELRLARDMGLNTIRMEGKEEDHELLDLADQYGIMLLPGWECCTKWEKYGTWTAEDHQVATGSIRAEAQRMVNHPSVLGFFIGSDNAAPADVEKSYVDTMRAADFPAPIIPSAANKATPILGRSGMKMDGPYWWIPPNYWYQNQLGGASGFASEIGSGPAIPELSTLQKYLSPQEIDDLWRNPTKPQYHLAKKEVFSTLTIFAEALSKRYGPPTSLEDFLRKAQLANYEANRAQFEAYGRPPATGMIYWMANNAWPTLYWHLWSYDLATAGSYFGAMKALRPVHAQYSYTDRSVLLANTGLQTTDVTVRATAFALDGRVLSDQTLPTTAQANGARPILQVPAVNETYLLRLLVNQNGREIDRNVYWLSTSDDQLDFAKSTWWYTPTTAYADFTALQTLPKATVETQIHGQDLVLRNTSTTVALAVRADLPGAHWSDNYVTLWPGEAVTLHADRPTHGTVITGFNL